eukprot:Sspe_Gene.98195::Locus_71648_Transcript_1_1_Confidence_1.000_Length_2239::g.98195::m.98195
MELHATDDEMLAVLDALAAVMGQRRGSARHRRRMVRQLRRRSATTPTEVIDVDALKDEEEVGTAKDEEATRAVSKAKAVHRRHGKRAAVTEEEHHPCVTQGGCRVGSASCPWLCYGRKVCLKWLQGECFGKGCPLVHSSDPLAHPHNPLEISGESEVLYYIHSPWYTYRKDALRGRTSKDTYLLARDVPGKYTGAKQFLCVPRHLVPLIISHTAPSERCLYAVVPPDDPVDLYMDVDYNIEPNAPAPTPDAIAEAIVDRLQYTLPSPARHLVVLDSSHATKISLHIHVVMMEGQAFPSSSALKAFVKASFPPTLCEWFRCIDYAVYSSYACFRLPFCTKRGEGRFFLPLHPHEGTNDDIVSRCLVTAVDHGKGVTGWTLPQPPPNHLKVRQMYSSSIAHVFRTVGHTAQPANYIVTRSGYYLLAPYQSVAYLTIAKRTQHYGLIPSATPCNFFAAFERPLPEGDFPPPSALLDEMLAAVVPCLLKRVEQDGLKFRHLALLSSGGRRGGDWGNSIRLQLHGVFHDSRVFRTTQDLYGYVRGVFAGIDGVHIVAPTGHAAELVALPWCGQAPLCLIDMHSTERCPAVRGMVPPAMLPPSTVSEVVEMCLVSHTKCMGSNPEDLKPIDLQPTRPPPRELLGELVGMVHEAYQGCALSTAVLPSGEVYSAYRVTPTIPYCPKADVCHSTPCVTLLIHHNALHIRCHTCSATITVPWPEDSQHIHRVLFPHHGFK